MFMSHPDRPLSWWLFYSCLTHNLIPLCHPPPSEPCVEDEEELEAEAGSPDIEPGTELDEGSSD